MNTIRCLVVDDEPIGRNILNKFVGKIGFLQLVAACEDAFEAIDLLESEEVDLLISDIQMPEINGLELVRSLPAPPVIIFVTAHDRFAVGSFELGVADYLLKPFSFERFLKAVNKARHQIDMNRQTTQMDYKKPEYLFIKADNKLNKIEFGDLLYIEAIGDYIRIFSNNAAVTSKCTLKLIEEKLPSEGFIRIHHSFVISLKSVKAIKKGYVELSNGKSLPIAKTRKEALYHALQIPEE